MKYWFTSQTPYVLEQRGLWVRPKYFDAKSGIQPHDKVVLYEPASDPDDESKIGASSVIAFGDITKIYEPPIKELFYKKNEWLKIAELDCHPVQQKCHLRDTLLILKPGKREAIKQTSNLGVFILGYGGKVTEITEKQYQYFQDYCMGNIPVVTAKNTRNPDWTRDELILAFDLYLRVNPNHVNEKHPEIIKLSQLLNKLPIFTLEERGANFRNLQGVYMKLCNFLRFDPNYQGKGLTAGSKLDEVIWNEFYPHQDLLIQAAEAIRNNYGTRDASTNKQTGLIDSDEEFMEGKLLTRLHKYKERNSSLTAKKKQQVLSQTNKLACEVCNFNFANFYGELGTGFAECHHNKPLSELDIEKPSKLSDLSIVCSNCHRILHRVRPWLAVAQLKALVQKK